MALRPETIDRVLAMWQRWAGDAVDDEFVGVGVVAIGDHRFLRAPHHLRDRFIDPPIELDDLVARLGSDLERVVGAARLAYADDTTLRLADPGALTPIGDDDPRLAALERVADRAEWLEASADEACEARLGIVDGDELLALATLHVWDETVGHFGVFTRADARGRHLARRTASGVIDLARARDTVPQWRSRIGNDASAAVADRLGFVPLGRQLFVRVRQPPGPSRTIGA
jgi:RimJ/RimL family protein N-acetyltransferase